MNIKKIIYERMLTSIHKERIQKQRDFEKWIEENKITKEDIEKQKNMKFNYEPKISIVIPLFNTKEKYFADLVNSIMNQTYKNIELCLADGSDKKLSYINKYLNDKIKYKYLNENKGIVGNTNEALLMATGDFVAFVDHDDVLEVNAMYEIVKIINKKPYAEIIYTDDDKIIENTNKRVEPQFKPDFSKDFLYSNNYICHLLVLKKELIQKIGLLNKEYEGAQDYDYILRAIQNVQSEKNIIHVPKILYHWRINKQSVAYSETAKPYAYENGKKALQDYFERKNIKVKVEQMKLPGFYKINYSYDKNEKIAVIINNISNKRKLEKCINAIKKSTYKNHEIIVVNNSDTYELHNEIKECTGNYIVVIDSDCIIQKDTLKEMISIFVREDVGVIGGKVLTKFGKIYQTGREKQQDGKIINIGQNEYSSEPGYMARRIINQNEDIVSNKIWMIRKEDYIEYEGRKIDLEQLQMDICLEMIKKNKTNVFVADAKAFII